MPEELRYNEFQPKGAYENSIFNEKTEAKEIEDILSKDKDYSSAAINRLATLRMWFEDAVTCRRKWSDQSGEDYAFYWGEQWPEQSNALLDGGRPMLTLNKIKNIVNAVVGYQSQNRYEPDFLPRTEDDLPLASIRKHVTKFILDQVHYPTLESRVFQDMCIGGIGWLYCGYCYDEFMPEGRIDIRRISPFDVYVDPEARELDYSDSEYIVYATWQSKGKVARLFPEHEDAIYALNDDRDISEDTVSQIKNTSPDVDPVWFVTDKKKIRLVTCWYKSYTTVEYIDDGTGSLVPVPDHLKGKLPKSEVVHTDGKCEIRCATYIQNVLLEDIPSPYEHGMFPLIPIIGYYTGEGDTPCGIIRDVKDAQMEINKRRSQILHIINTTAWNGILAEQGVFSKQQKDYWRKFGSKPGMIMEMSPGALSGGKMMPIEPKPLPTAIAQLESAFEADLRSITGINEEMLGIDVPKNASGRAIELRQRSATTQIALLFDALRDMKLRMMRLFWGRGLRPGLVQQFFKERMIIRITEPSEEAEFKEINRPWHVGNANDGSPVVKTINDLTVGDFDIVITEAPATPTKRFADFLAFMEMMKTPLGAVVSQVAPDLFLEFSDLPNKHVIAQRLRDAIPTLRPGFVAPDPMAQQDGQNQQQANGLAAGAMGSQSNAPSGSQLKAQADGIDMALEGSM